VTNKPSHDMIQLIPGNTLEMAQTEIYDNTAELYHIDIGH